MDWIAGIMIPVVIAFMVWVGSSLVELKMLVASTKTQNQNDKEQIDVNTGKIDGLANTVNGLNNRVLILETKFFKNGLD
jgi:hypothetical protein